LLFRKHFAVFTIDVKMLFFFVCLLLFFSQRTLGYKCYETFNMVRNTEIRNTEGLAYWKAT